MEITKTNIINATNVTYSIKLSITPENKYYIFVYFNPCSFFCICNLFKVRLSKISKLFDKNLDEHPVHHYFSERIVKLSGVEDGTNRLGTIALVVCVVLGCI